MSLTGIGFAVFAAGVFIFALGTWAGVTSRKMRAKTEGPRPGHHRDRRWSRVRPAEFRRVAGRFALSGDSSGTRVA
jgi:hypothetical protein